MPQPIFIHWSTTTGQWFVDDRVSPVWCRTTDEVIAYIQSRKTAAMLLGPQLPPMTALVKTLNAASIPIIFG